MAVYPNFSPGGVLLGSMLRGMQVEVIEATNDFSVTDQDIDHEDPELSVRLERNASYCIEAVLLYRSTVDTQVGITLKDTTLSVASARQMTLGPTESAVATDFISANETRLNLLSGGTLNFFSRHQVNNDSVDVVVSKSVIVNTSTGPITFVHEMFKSAATGVLTRSPGSYFCITRFA